MSIDITSGHNGTLSLKLTIGAVFDPVRLSTPSLVKGETKFPIFERSWMSQSWLRTDWSFKSLFDTEIARSCSVASSSEVHVYPAIGDPYAITPPADQERQGVSVYDLNKCLYLTRISDYGCSDFVEIPCSEFTSQRSDAFPEP